MFSNLRDSIASSFRRVVLHNIKTSTSDFIAKLRQDLLSSDVSLHFVNELIEELKKQSSGRKFRHVNDKIEFFIRISRDKIIDTLGNKPPSIKLSQNQVMVVLVCGTQGAGKTSFCGKLAFKMKNTYGPDPILVTSTDNQRPAAQMQLEHLCRKAGVEFYGGNNIYHNPTEPAMAAYQYAQEMKKMLLIIDTAGYTHTQADKQNLQQIKNAINPQEILLVVDSMTGQAIGNIGNSFDRLLDLTGVCITKTDSNNSIGASISMRYAIQKPIKYLCTGEAIEQLTEFNPQRITNQLLEIGDLETLIEGVDAITDQHTEMALSQKIQDGKFDCDDLLLQLYNIKRMGGMSKITNLLPGSSNISQSSTEIDANISQQIASILSMTPEERKNPHIINISRKVRIAKGAGVKIKLVTSVLQRLQTLKTLLANATSEQNEIDQVKELHQHTVPYKPDAITTSRISKVRHKRRI